MIPQVLPTHQPNNLERTISELTSQILLSRCLTRTQQENLMVIRRYPGLLMEEEKTLIDRVLYGVRHGLLTVTEHEQDSLLS